MFEIILQLFGGRGGTSGGVRGNGNANGGKISSANLPDLRGSEKQIKWAEDIRSTYINEFNAFQEATKMVFSGRGDEAPRSVHYGAKYRGVVARLGPRLRRNLTNTTDPLRGKTDAARGMELISRMRKTFREQTDARFWIDRR